MVEYRNNICFFEDNKESELEKFVGIQIYSTFELKGIGGVYKNSYKDFVVQEITENGNVLGFRKDKQLSTTDNYSKYKYTTFNLVKVNRDTFDAVRLISKALKIPVDKIEYSGLKDKCSLSVQRISIPGNFVDRLKKLNIRDVFIRDISLSKRSIRLGSNWGNKFTITIRNVEKKSKNKKNIEKSLFKIKQSGFPNYYGLQRFGTFRPNSHLIGRYLLENKFKEAYNEFILNTYSTESELSRNVRIELRDTANLEKALEQFPKSLNYERQILKYLINNPGDYEGAMRHLPSYLIKLILSSFQSYLFNKLLSLRVKKGHSLFKPANGDVISILDDMDGQLTQIKYIFGGSYDTYLKEALNLKRASIVIPLVGYDSNLDEFPLMQSLLLDILEEEQISPSIFHHDLLKDHDFKGSYRSMLVRPKDLNLIEIEPDDIFQNKQKVKIEFSLSKGSYATMLLREIMKM